MVDVKPQDPDEPDRTVWRPESGPPPVPGPRMPLRVLGRAQVPHQPVENLPTEHQPPMSQAPIPQAPIPQAPTPQAPTPHAQPDQPVPQAAVQPAPQPPTMQLPLVTRAAQMARSGQIQPAPPVPAPPAPAPVIQQTPPAPVVPPYMRAAPTAPPKPKKTLPRWADVAVRAFDPHLTTRLREERHRYATLRAKVRPGSSIAVISAAPNSGASTVAALLARAFAEFHGDRVLAVDGAPSAGLTARLATRAGALDEVLRTLGIRDAQGADQPTYRWLRSRLDIAGGVMVLAPETPLTSNNPPLTENEYPSVIRRLGRWFPLTITDVDPAYPELLGSVIRTADRLLIVAIADEAGLAWLARALGWLHGAIERPLADAVVSVLVQPVPGPVPVFALPTPAFVIPYDDTLRDAGTLSWQRISPLTRRAVEDLAVDLAARLSAGN